mgnify:CR=1 FL=1
MSEHEHVAELLRLSDERIARSREIIGEPDAADEMVARVVEIHAPDIERPMSHRFGLGFGELDSSRITQALSEPERAEHAARWTTWAILLACAGLLYAATMMGR